MLKNFSYRLFFTFLSASLAGIASPLLANDVSTNAADDHFSGIAGKSINISDDILLANDGVMPHSELVITAQPTGGLFDDQSGYRTFRPDQEAFGTYEMTYELRTEGIVSTATVTFHILPPVTPLAGRWPTSTCHAASCPPKLEPGHGAEIGWYDATIQTFELCDWVGGSGLTECRSLEIEGPVAGWTPFVLDYDGDGFDEVALRDPTNGEMQIFSTGFANFTTHEGQRALATIIFGIPSSLPLIGSWSGGAQNLGVYEPGFGGGTGGFILDATAEGIQIPFDSPDRALAIAGDWLNTGTDRIGLIDLDAKRLHHLSVQDPSVGAQFNAWVWSARGIPFSGRLWSADSRSFLGYFDPSSSSFRLLGFWQEDDTIGTLPLDMLVDPPSLHRLPAQPVGGGSEGEGGGEGGKLE